MQGFPADTVNFALDGGIPTKPQLVASGINAGANLGPVTGISGTVGAARTAVRRGVPAVAISQGTTEGVEPDYPAGVRQAVTWVKEHRKALTKKNPKPPTEVANINVPTCTTGKVRGPIDVPSATAGDVTQRAELRVEGEEPSRRRGRVRERLRAAEPGAARLTYAYSALWKMIPSVVRSPVWTVLTPCRIATRLGPRLPGTGRSRVGKSSACPRSRRATTGRDCCARTLLHEDVLAPGEVLVRRAQHDRDLQRERDLAVEVLVQAVVPAGPVAQQQRRRPVLPGRRAHLDEAVERVGERAPCRGRPPTGWRSSPAARTARPGAAARPREAGRRSSGTCPRRTRGVTSRSCCGRLRRRRRGR